jgi:hypothetical protein
MVLIVVMKPHYSLKTSSLPSDFAEQLLDRECELDACWSGETVGRLMELYTVRFT